jgi:hypothetical protein
MLHECPVTLYGRSIVSVCLLFKSSGQGSEETKDLIPRYIDRLLEFFEVYIAEYTDFRGNSYAEIYYIFSQAAWWFVYGRIRRYSIIWLVLIRIVDYLSVYISKALKPLF